MRLNTLAFLLGILSCHTLSHLPDKQWGLLALPLLGLLVILPHLRYVLFYALGFLWLVWRANMILAQDLAPVLEDQDIIVIGSIIHLPVKQENGWQFDFAPTQTLFQNQVQPNPGHLRLDWPRPITELRPGQQWRLTVRLKRIHTSRNPNTLDYSGILLQQRIRATGYVRESEDIQLLQSPNWLNIDALRYRLAEAVRTVLGNHPHTGTIIALAIGQQRAISQEQWDIWRETGTIHLISISGLHLSLIALLTFWIARWLWSYGGQANRLPAQRFAAWASLFTAISYALLAGFSIPTQRSLIMITVALSNILLARSVAISNLLAGALFLVLLYDPLAIMSLGFWLSFGAIAFIAYTTTGRRFHPSRLTRWGLNFARTQWAVTLGLLPILLSTFGYLSLIPPIANAIAVPWISFVITPLVLLGTVLVLPYPELSHFILEIAAHLLAALWTTLVKLADLHWIWYLPIPSLWIMILAMISVIILLLPRGFPAKWLGLIGCLPLFFTPLEQPQLGELWLTVLDVGQGLAVVARTQNHLLIYDTGPRRDAVIIPFLRAQGLQQVDTLVVSHDDKDHNGGSESVLQALSVTTVLTSAPAKFPRQPTKRCLAGQEWRWDDVNFQVLHPKHPYSEDNRNSCVLKITATGGAVLLTGDIDKMVERELVETIKADLAATVLVVPHHGSKNSSMPIFIDAVQPKIAIISAGYRNRYQHPHAETVRRYTIRSVQLLDTVDMGAVSLHLSNRGLTELKLARRWYSSSRYLPIQDEFRYLEP